MSNETEKLIEHLNAQHLDIKGLHAKAGERLGAIDSRLTEVEQALAQRHRGGGPGVSDGLGNIVIKSEAYKNFVKAGCKGTYRVPLEGKSITTLGSSGGALIPEDRQREPVMIPRQRLTVRDLLAQGQTGSNLIKFTKQTGRTNNARVVTEGHQKPESNVTFELAEAPVRTIATWIPVSRQVMDDAPLLASTIDSELRYFIGLEEEEEILFGDGTGEHIQGLSVQVAGYNAPFTVEAPTRLDTILIAIAQAQQSRIMTTGIIVNDLDWKRMQAIKDAQERYILSGPGGAIGSALWQVPVVDTPAMPEGEFMVGGFAIAAQIVDRMETEVLVSSEASYTSGGNTVHSFISNMLVVRAEERVALAVKIPEAIVYGDFDTATA